MLVGRGSAKLKSDVLNDVQIEEEDRARGIRKGDRLHICASRAYIVKSVAKLENGKLTVVLDRAFKPPPHARPKGSSHERVVVWIYLENRAPGTNLDMKLLLYNLEVAPAPAPPPYYSPLTTHHLPLTPHSYPSFLPLTTSFPTLEQAHKPALELLELPFDQRSARPEDYQVREITYHTCLTCLTCHTCQAGP